MFYYHSNAVYHGTNLFAAKMILHHGIMLNAQRELTDFGKGFYVTFNQKQAKDWAYVKAKNPQVHPTLLKTLNINKHQYFNHPDTKIPVYLAYKIDLNCLAFLRGIIFPMPHEPSWPFYETTWKTFVKNCRMGIGHSYDFVYGPIGRRHLNGIDQAKTPTLKEQLSLNSHKAIRCLSKPTIFTLKPISKLYTLIPHSHTHRKNPPNVFGLRHPFLREIRDCIMDIVPCSNRDATHKVKNSWLASHISEHETAIMHETAAYWAFSILYGDQRLWYSDYEKYISKSTY